MRFRGPGSGRPRAGCAAVRAAGVQAGKERPGSGGKPVRKRGPDTLFTGGQDRQIREVGPLSGLPYVVLFLAIFSTAKSCLGLWIFGRWRRVREGALFA